MPVAYEFAVGERVYCESTGQHGTVARIEGDNPWYYVHQDNGNLQPFLADDLTAL